MVNKCIILIFVFVFPLYSTIYAQTTYYYRIIKSVINGKTSTDLTGGQFITFNGNVCYESDNRGNQINESRMIHQYNDNGLNVYYGMSYWGINTTFFFTSDQSKLSVRAYNGDKYVYERITPPANTLTSSLIRDRQQNETYISQPGMPTTTSGNNGRSISSSASNSSPSIPRTRCPNCTNGRRIYESDVPYSGTTIRYSTCSECGLRYQSSHRTHRHDRCTTCHGTGYLD